MGIVPIGQDDETNASDVSVNAVLRHDPITAFAGIFLKAQRTVVDTFTIEIVVNLRAYRKHKWRCRQELGAIECSSFRFQKCRYTALTLE